MTETVQRLPDYEESEVTGVRNKVHATLLDILSKMDEETLEAGIEDLRKLAEQNGHPEILEKYDDDELMKMVAIKDLPLEQLQQMAHAKHNVGFHGGIPALLDHLFLITGDHKFKHVQAA